MQPIIQTRPVFHLEEHNYFKITSPTTTAQEQLIPPGSNHTKQSTENVEPSTTQQASVLPKIRRPTQVLAKVQIPLKICHTSCVIQTKEHRRIVMALQHKELTKKERSTLTKQLKHMLDNRNFKNKKLQRKYYTHRILYINTKKTTSPIDSETIWNEDFMSNRPSAEQTPHTDRRNRYYIKACKNKLLKLLQEPAISLFNKIENYSITFPEYKLLRKHIINVTETEPLKIRQAFFPGIVCVARQKESELTQATHPSYRLASKTYLKLTKTKHRSAHVLTTEQQTTIQRMQTIHCSSLEELEQLASSLYSYMNPGSFSCLIHQAIHNMENAGLLPINKQEDFNDPDTVAKYALSKKCKPPISKSTDNIASRQKPTTSPASYATIQKRNHNSSKQSQIKTSKNHRKTTDPRTSKPTSSDWTQSSQNTHNSAISQENVMNAAMALLLLSSSKQ